MKVTNWRYTLLLLLCLVAGMVDVIGFLELGHVFTANMTGNIVLLGMAIGQSQELAVLRAGIALMGFIGGNILGAALLGESEGSRPKGWPPKATRLLGVEVLLLLAFTLWHWLGEPTPAQLYGLIILLSCAMGLQTSAGRSLGIAGISTTVLTNNLTHTVEDGITYVRRLRQSRRDRTAPLARWSRDTLLRLAALVTYLLGAIAAALAINFGLYLLLWLPVVLVGSITLLAWLLLHPRPDDNASEALR